MNDSFRFTAIPRFEKQYTHRKVQLMSITQTLAFLKNISNLWPGKGLGEREGGRSRGGVGAGVREV